MYSTSINPMSILQVLKFPYKGGYHMFSPEQIIRLQSDSNYTYLHIKDRRPILMAKVLSDYENMLAPFGFIRTHKSHLINQQHIKDVSSKNQITMDDESVVQVSRRKVNVLKKMLNVEC